MKKFIFGAVVVSTLALSGVSAFAAQSVNQDAADYAAVQDTAYSATAAYDEATAVEDYISAQEARKAYLEDMYSRGLITKERYDLSVAAIQADIDYVTENGLSTPNISNGYGGYGGGYGYGGCCWGW